MIKFGMLKNCSNFLSLDNKKHNKLKSERLNNKTVAENLRGGSGPDNLRPKLVQFGKFVPDFLLRLVEIYGYMRIGTSQWNVFYCFCRKYLFSCTNRFDGWKKTSPAKLRMMMFHSVAAGHYLTRPEWKSIVLFGPFLEKKDAKKRLYPGYGRGPCWVPRGGRWPRPVRK